MKHKIDVPTLQRMLRHYKLINAARKRGYSAVAIAKLVKAAEDAAR